MIRVKDHRQSTHHLADYLPWAAVVAPGVIMQKDGIMQSTFKVVGHNFFCCDESSIETIIASANNLFMYCDAGWSVFVEAQRNKQDTYIKSEWNNDVLRAIDEERKKYYEENPLFNMDYFFTICYQEQKTDGKVNRFFSEKENSLETELEDFLKKKKDFLSLLSECFLSVEALNDDETLSYIHSTISSARQKVTCPPRTMYIDSFVSDESLSISDGLMLGENYLGVISVHDFPHMTRADILEGLQMLDIDFRWQTRMIFLDEMQAIKDIKKYRRKHYSQRKGVFKVMQEQKTGEEGLENTEALMRAIDAEEALELAGKNLLRFGYITSVVVVSDREMTILKEKINAIKEVFQKKGFVVKEEQLNAMDAWLSSLPGQVYSNVRKFLIHSVNLAHILPLSARWRGEKSNQHMKKICGVDSPHMLVSSQSNSFFLNLNNGDVGHTFVIGPTGAGKSTLLGMLSAQFWKYPNAQVIIFDKDYSALPLTKKCQGKYFAPGSLDKTLSFQPFRDINKESERQWAMQFCAQLLELHDITITGDIIAELKRAIELMSNLPIQERRVSTLRKIIQHKEIRQILEKFCSQDMLGTLFDGVEEHNFNSNWLMFEMGYLMGLGHGAIMPALSYLFHKVEEMFNGNPTLLILDEGWLFLQHPAFSEQFKVWLKTLRKKNVFVIMATQEIADAVKSPLLETIISACQTRIYLPDKSAHQVYMKEFYYNFGLHEREVEIIASAIAKKEYYIKTNHGACLFNMDLGQYTLDVLTKHG